MEGAYFPINEGGPITVITSTLKTRTYEKFLQLTPSDAPVAGTPSAGGSITDGTHSYKVTFVTFGGGETLPSAKSNVITAGSGNNTSAITVSVGGKNVVARKLYRTVAGDTGDWKLVTTIQDNTTTTFSDTIADGSLGASAPTVSTTDIVAEACKGIMLSADDTVSICNADGSRISVALLGKSFYEISVAHPIIPSSATVYYLY